MQDIILHHYEISPFAEKIRLVLGFKRLAWQSVQIPIVMPKPDLTALTGGYRLTPVLQIGADIYCDTKVIALALERLKPRPTLYPEGNPAIARGLAFWAETLFMDLVTILFGSGGFPKEFVDDRQKLIPGGVDLEQAKAVVPSKRDQVRAKLDLLERQLGDRAYLLGEAASLADLSAYPPLWATASLPATKPALDPYPNIQTWMGRIAEIGHGERTEIDSKAAIEVARSASPATEPALDEGDPSGRRPGDRLLVFPEDYGRDPVQGELVASNAHEIAIRRRDERVGDVVVHFPREGCLTLAAS